MRTNETREIAPYSGGWMEIEKDGLAEIFGPRRHSRRPVTS
jgi:hypothetical protein